MNFSPRDYIEVRISMAGIKHALINRRDALLMRLMTGEERTKAFPGGSPGVDLLVFEDAQGKGPLMTLTTPDELAGLGVIKLGNHWVFADNINLGSVRTLTQSERFQYIQDHPGEPTPNTRFEIQCRYVTPRIWYTEIKHIDFLIAIDQARLEARQQLRRLYGADANPHQPALASLE
jgi:hypothetical protein